MKNLLMAALLMFSFSSFANVKIGIVNIQKILTEVEEGKSVNETLKKSFDSKQKQLKKMEDDVRALQEKLQKQDKVLSDSAKAKKMAEIQTKMNDARQQTMSFQKEIQKQEAQLKKPILNKMKDIIDSISAAEGVAITFEVSASPVVYAASKVDLTDKVIKAYDKKYSK